MKEFETILFSLEDGIATITLNRPDHLNAFTYGMALELISAFDETDRDDAVKAVIVTGTGERAFCAGADLGGEETHSPWKSGLPFSNGSQSAVSTPIPAVEWRSGSLTA